jgi:hypothetical protein
MNLSASLSLVVLVILTAGVFVLREGAKWFASDQAGEIVTRLNRATALQRELESARGEERQTLRFTCYGKLWVLCDRSPFTAAWKDTSMHLSSASLCSSRREVCCALR